MTHHHDHTTAIGTLTGTVFTVFAHISSQDIIRTIIMAVVGATVSFMISKLWRWLWELFRR